MRNSIVAFALVVAPSFVAGQQSAAVSGRGTTNAGGSATVGRQSVGTQSQSNAEASASMSIPADFSAESRAQLAATFTAAREHDVPREPIANRIAEGRARGAAEAQIVLAARRMEARLDAAQEAMVRAGRAEPSDAEVSRGALALERGATTAQIEALVRHEGSGRSLVVALDVLAFGGTSATASGAASAGLGSGAGASAAGSAAGSAGGVLGGGAAGVGGAVSGAVTGTIRGRGGE